MDRRQTALASSCLFLLCFATFTVAEVLQGNHHHRHHHHDHHRNGAVKLFVFGDSYVDTGNIRKSISPSWKQPYGITFPGKPAGRFSDGRVLTDYLASFLGIRSPMPYELRKYVNKTKLENGMNFAFGGTGVFDTMVSGPNLTTQIDFFQQLLDQKVYTKNNMNSSIALVSVAGNDYATHFGKPGNDSKNWTEFSASLVNQLGVDLKRIHDLGVRKLAVTGIEPLGCVPLLSSFSSYKNCSGIANMASMFHNQILGQKVQELNKQANHSTFVTLDLYNAFMSGIKPQQQHPGLLNLEPCCVGVSEEYTCGSVDESGAKKYRICNDPNKSFFWDMVHPSQNGWFAVYSAMKSSLSQLLYS